MVDLNMVLMRHKFDRLKLAAPYPGRQHADAEKPQVTGSSLPAGHRLA
jgi:hypothetical protein